MPQNYKKTDVAAIKPGYKAVAYIAAKSWFTTLSAPNPAGSGDLTERIIEDHVFASGKGFLEIVQVRKKNTGMGETKGDEGALYLNHKYTCVIPGDGSKLQKLMKELLNDDLILLMEDPECETGQVVQLGCSCDPGAIVSMKHEAGTLRGDTGKAWTIEIETGCRAFYEGTIETYP